MKEKTKESETSRRIIQGSKKPKKERVRKHFSKHLLPNSNTVFQSFPF